LDTFHSIFIPVRGVILLTDVCSGSTHPTHASPAPRCRNTRRHDMTCSPLTAAPIATAEPNTNGWDEDNFNACVAQIPAGDTDYKYHYFLCCQQNGGTPTDRPDLKGCAVPVGNGVMGHDQQLETMDPAPPPPGPTAILPRVEHTGGNGVAAQKYPSCHPAICSRDGGRPTCRLRGSAW
jgi:hypothetical protein